MPCPALIIILNDQSDKTAIHLIILKMILPRFPPPCAKVTGWPLLMDGSLTRLIIKDDSSKHCISCGAMFQAL